VFIVAKPPPSKAAGHIIAEHETPPGGRALSKPWAIAAAVILILTAAVSLYLMLGKPIDSESHQLAAGDQSPQVTQEQIIAMVEGLAQKLKTKPNDGPGWAMLGRSYATLRRFSDASMAYQRAVALIPNDAPLLTEYADVLAMANGRNVQGEPEKIVQQALAIDPNNIKAMALAGTAAFQRQDYPEAILWWQKILKLVPPESQVARSITANISQAQGIAGAMPTARPIGSTNRAIGMPQQ
jgi:cytochrome c-type biogenesis protein CcmH